MKPQTVIAILTVLVLTACSFTLAGFAREKTDEELKKWKCNSKRFVLPESADPRNIDHARLAVKANPMRFEAHLMLAGCYAGRGEYANAVMAFDKTDKYIVGAPIEEQREYEYESIYSICLAALGTQRYADGRCDVHTLRLFQRALGMNIELLKEKKRLPRIYMFMADIYIRIGRMNRALEYAKKGNILCNGKKEFSKEAAFFEKIISIIEGGRNRK